MPLWTFCQKLGEPMDDDGDDAYGVHSCVRGSKTFLVCGRLNLRGQYTGHVAWRGVYLGLGQCADCVQRLMVIPVLRSAIVHHGMRARRSLVRPACYANCEICGICRNTVLRSTF